MVMVKNRNAIQLMELFFNTLERGYKYREIIIQQNGKIEKEIIEKSRKKQ